MDVNHATASLGSFNKAASLFSALAPNRCDWCLCPFREIYHARLCRRCYEIKRTKRRLLKEVKEKWNRDSGMPWKALDLRLRCDCHLIGKMEENAIAEGAVLEADRHAAHSGMTLEDLLGYLSHQLVHENLYYDCATTLTGLFSPFQREALIHLLYELVDRHRTFNRRRRIRANLGPRLVELSQLPPDWLNGSDTTNPSRRNLDRDMLARKAAFLEIIKRGTERDFIQALRGFGKGEDTTEGQLLITAFRKWRGFL